jgi:glucose dehydrogenase
MMHAMKLLRCLLPVATILFCAFAHPQEKDTHVSRDWPVWGGGPENMHYSALSQINRRNVKTLVTAWTFDTEAQGGCKQPR